MVDKRVSQKQKKNPEKETPVLGYCLIKLTDRENMLSVFKELAGLGNVLDIEAIRGKSDLIVLISAPNNKRLIEFYIQVVKENPQFLECVFLPISCSLNGTQHKDTHLDFLSCKDVSAYIQIEMDPSMEKELPSRLIKLPGVSSCSVINHQMGMIVKVHAPNFNKVEEVVTRSIKPLNGIIRLNLLKVIDLAAALNYPRLNQEVWKFQGEVGQIILLLQSAQESFGYIPEIAVKYISGVTGRPESELYGIITFYKQFRLRPVGKYLVRLCDGTACHVNNAKMLREVIIDELKLTNDDTTPDGFFTLVPVACLGCCSLAPAMMVNDMTHGRLSPQSIRSILRNYRKEGLAQMNSAEVAK
jgi:NADH:ubiquinone oxidoreductase subunit E